MKKIITISEIAGELNIAKSTVSRAISGKGRIGKTTRQNVLDFIERNDYEIQGIKKAALQNKTYSIGVVIPIFSDAVNLPFFERCILGVCDAAQEKDYDVIVTSVDNDDIHAIQRLVINKKIDGMILTRTHIDDRAIKYLKQHDIPFVVIGTVNDLNIYQVDSDNKSGCKELTAYMAMIGMERIGLIGGDSGHRVTMDRLQGFKEGLQAAEKTMDSNLVFLDSGSVNTIRQAVEKLIKRGVDCIACMDDYICSCVVKELRRRNDNPSRGIQLASFYGMGDETFQGADVYSLRYNPSELSAEAARLLFQQINHEDRSKRIKLGYEVILRKTSKQ